jgi:antitoxin (DNA-binding transcriptional repressor) of toxin-antitoxin stability system
LYICSVIEKEKDMIVLTGREFRANQAKYVGVAQSGEDVVVKSRVGSFRIVPIAEDDIIISKNNLSESLYRALLEVKNAREGKGKLLSWEDFKHEMER